MLLNGGIQLSCDVSHHFAILVMNLKTKNPPVWADDNVLDVPWRFNKILTYLVKHLVRCSGALPIFLFQRQISCLLLEASCSLLNIIQSPPAN